MHPQKEGTGRPGSEESDAPDLAYAHRRRKALDALAVLQAPDETRRAHGLPRLADDLRWRLRAAARRLRLRFELCHISTVQLERFVVESVELAPSREQTAPVGWGRRDRV